MALNYLTNYTSSSSSRMRISGLSSGIDTEAVVEQLMQAESYKANSVFRQSIKASWKLDAYTDLTTSLRSFRDTYFSALKPDSNMLSSASYKSYDVVNDNKTYVGITAGGSAAGGTYTMKIQQLAKAAGSSSASRVSADNTGLSGTYISLKTLAGRDSETATPLSNPLKLTKLGTKEQVITDSNGNVATDENGNPLTRTVDNYKLLFSVNGVDFEFDEDATLQTVMDTVNGNTTANVKMSYSQLTDSFSIVSKTTGEGQTVTLGAFSATTDSEGNTVTATNLSDQNFFSASAADSALGLATGSYENGQNALLTINDVAVERTTNSFSIDGIAYTLNRATETDKTLTFNLNANVDAPLEKITKFVEAYNELIVKFQNLLKETDYSTSKNGGYEPLTADERSSMTDDQIEQWETYAKSGLLRSDTNLSSLVTAMRNAISTPVSPSGKSLANFGIKTGSYENGGKLEIDTTKLREALTSNPEQVMSVFTAVADDTANANTAYNNTGVINRVLDKMNDFILNMEDTVIKNQKNLIDDYQDRYYELMDELDDKEEAYWRKYSAMETAMASLQSQSDSLISQITSMNSSK